MSPRGLWSPGKQFTDLDETKGLSLACLEGPPAGSDQFSRPWAPRYTVCTFKIHVSPYLLFSIFRIGLFYLRRNSSHRARSGRFSSPFTQVASTDVTVSLLKLRFLSINRRFRALALRARLDE
jgi:hypothetical protein